MRQGHDARYKWVFSHPAFVKKFLTSFVRLPFVKKLDFDAMERLDKEFVSEEFRTLESDIVYKIPYQESCIYIFLLIEFQSSVDKTMPFRFLRYTGELYRFAKPNPQSGLYPATFPVLLYNGDEDWTVPCNTMELIEKSIPENFIPRFQYFPVLINQFSKRSLVKIRNIVSAMFYIENSQPSELEAGMEELVEIIKNEDIESVRILGQWFNGYLSYLSKYTGNFDAEAAFAKITSSLEVGQMFATKLKEYEETLMTRGRVEGRAEGRVEGRVEGRAEGITQGRAEGKLETARRMLADEMPLDSIIRYTNLSREEIIALRDTKG